MNNLKIFFGSSLFLFVSACVFGRLGAGSMRTLEAAYLNEEKRARLFKECAERGALINEAVLTASKRLGETMVEACSKELSFSVFNKDGIEWASREFRAVIKPLQAEKLFNDLARINGVYFESFVLEKTYDGTIEFCARIISPCAMRTTADG